VMAEMQLMTSLPGSPIWWSARWAQTTGTPCARTQFTDPRPERCSSSPWTTWLR
jgi:hypothetical protein